MRRRLLTGLAIVIGAAIAIQIIPYGRNHANPQIASEPAWSSPHVRDLAVRACFDCHSNETLWPWYSKVAPVSWLVQWDVDRGRDQLNFSRWNQPQKEAGEAVEVLQEGGMPPWFYTVQHSSAKLTPDEVNSLIREFQTTLANR